MDEPRRTLLGHFRHEIAHYYYYRLIGPSPDYRATHNLNCCIAFHPFLIQKQTKLPFLSNC